MRTMVVLAAAVGAAVVALSTGGAAGHASATAAGTGIIVYDSGHYLHIPGGGSDSESMTSIWQIRPDGTGKQRLWKTKSTEEPVDGVQVSPDGRNLIFDYQPKGVPFERLWLANRNGSGAHPIGPGHGVIGYGPLFSPDGSKIAYWQPGGSTPTSSHLEFFIAKRNGSHAAVVELDDSANEAAWGADGQLYFPARLGIYTAPPSPPGGYSKQLVNYTQLPGRASNLSVSPDGKMLAFSTWQACSGPSCTLFVMNTNGSGLRAIPSSAGAAQPAISPDGTMVAYRTHQGLWVAPLNNSARPRLLVRGAIWDIDWVSR